MTNEKKAALCPNCQGPAIREGNDIICESCDAIFHITKTGGAKVKRIGEIEDLKNRVAALEAKDEGQGPEQLEDDQKEEDQDQEKQSSEDW